MTATRRFEIQPLLREMQRSLRSSPAFAFYALTAIGYAAFFIAFMFGQMAWRVDIFLPGAFGQMTHGAPGPHRVHDVTYGLLVTASVVGVLAQLRRPSKNVASMVMALIPFAGLLLANVLSADSLDAVRRNPLYLFAALAGVTALLHPTGRRCFASFSVTRANRVMLTLVGIAAIPLLSFASTNIGLQGTVGDDHDFLGHYGFMAALSCTVIGVGVLASLRPDGWRLTAWVAGLLAAVLGGSALVYPDAASSFTNGWALASIAWGAAFISVSVLTSELPGLAPLGARRVEPTPEEVAEVSGS